MLYFFSPGHVTICLPPEAQESPLSLQEQMIQFGGNVAIPRKRFTTVHKSTPTEIMKVCLSRQNNLNIYPLTPNCDRFIGFLWLLYLLCVEHGKLECSNSGFADLALWCIWVMNIVSKAPTQFFPCGRIVEIWFRSLSIFMWLDLRTNAITHTEQSLPLLVYKITYIALNK